MKSRLNASIPIRLATSACSTLLVSAAGVAQTEVFEFPDGSGSCCTSVGTAGDFDSDGSVDVLVVKITGSVVYSGFDGTALLKLPGDWSGAALGDVNGDNVTDYLFGNPVRAYSGATHSLLYSVNAGAAQLLSVADLNGDSVVDFCVSGSSPSVLAFSGVNGSPLWSGDVPDGYRPFSIASLGADITGDGITEIVVGGISQPSPNVGLFVRVLSGANGQLQWEQALTNSVEDVATLDDVNGNLVPDIAVDRLGFVSILEGLDGTLIRSFATLTTPFGDRDMDAAGDVDGDGIDDILLGETYASDTETGAVHIYLGRSGALLWSSFGKTPGEGFGWSVAGLGDITGDGIPEVAVGTSNGAAARVLSGALLPNGLSLAIGAGCTPIGMAPLLAASPPVVGETFTTFLTGALANSPAFVLFSPIPSSPRTLANGCTIYTQIGSGARLGSGVTSTSGTWALNTAVPYVPSLIGLELALQATILGTPTYQLSSGLHLLVGL